MHIGQFVLSWTANLSFSRDEQIRPHSLCGSDIRGWDPSIVGAGRGIKQ